MSDFRKALLSTAIPIVVVALISVIPFPPLWFLWFAAALIAVIALVTGIILLFVNKYRQIAAGIFAGIGIGILALGVTCFAITEELNRIT